MNTPLILNASRLSQSKELPLALTGLPSEVGGQKAHYVRKEVARIGHYTHRGNGSAIDITTQRADKWVDAFQKRTANGYRPFVPGQHRATFNAADNHGYVIDLKREGESLYATMQLIGDNALELAAKNDVSIYVIPDALDAKGNTYDEALEHIALTPNPALPDLQPFVKMIAASADAPARDVPVYELSATTPAPSRKENTMTPELAKQFREKLGIAADVPDDKLPDLAAQKALSLSADVSTITTERDTLKTERDSLKVDVEAKQQQLQLSADKKLPDPVMLSMFSENIATKRQLAIESGAISEAEVKAFDALLNQADGTPTVLALSACGTSKRPLGFQLWDALGKLGANGVRVGNKLPAGATPAEPNPYLRLSGDGGNEESESKMIERTRKDAEEYRKQQLAARGITA
jgi:hypothetical protein